MKNRELLKSIFLFVLLSIGASSAKAQDKAEHLYIFDCVGINSGQDEKIFAELMIGFDPWIRVSYDRGLDQVKIIASEALVENDLITAAATVSVTLTFVSLVTYD